MIVDISQGQVHLNKLTRGIKRRINAEMFKGVTIPMATDVEEVQKKMQSNEIPMQNILDSSEMAIELLIKTRNWARKIDSFARECQVFKSGRSGGIG